MHTLTVSVIDKDLTFPAVASDEVTTAPSDGMTPVGLSIINLVPIAVVPV
ncbi:MAG: hypothetical protein ACI4XN_07360 [Candidatus Kurthia intestinigallinarum]